MQSSWAQEHSQALREYLERGLSYSEIANAINERFHTDYTRSAAIGRARRMGLSGAKQPAAALRTTTSSQPGLPRLGKLGARPIVGLRPRPGVLRRAAALSLRCIGVAPRHLTLLELEDGDCRYPYGGEEEGEAITFCGHPRREGSSYCTSHFYLTSGIALRDPATGAGQADGRARLRLVEAA